MKTWIKAHPYLTAFLVISVLIFITGVVLLSLYIKNGGLYSLKIDITRSSPLLKNRFRTLAGTDYLTRTTMDIMSLKYAIMDVTLARDATLTGTAFNNPVGQISTSLQDVSISNDKYRSFSQKDAEEDSTIKWYDVMDKAGMKTALAQAVISRDITSTATATAETSQIQFVSVTYLRPIKFKAQATFPDGRKMVTVPSKNIVKGKDAETQMDLFYTRPADDDVLFTTVDQEAKESIAINNNGGTWIRLAEPFDITAAVQAESRLVLVYDPYLSFRAEKVDTGDAETDVPDNGFYDKAGNFWDVPIMHMVPVLVPKNDYVYRQVFQIPMTSQEPNFSILIVIYYVGTAVDAVKGVSLTIMDGGTPLPVPTNWHVPQPFYVSKGADNKWQFQDYKKRPLVSDFVRTAIGTCKIHQYDEKSWGFPGGTETGLEVGFQRIIHDDVVDD